MTINKMKIVVLTLFMFIGVTFSMPQGVDNFGSSGKRCLDYEDLGYRCVSYFQCEECNNTIITDGASLFDVKSASIDEDICLSSELHLEAVTSSCDKDNENCCRHPSFEVPGQVEGPTGGPIEEPPTPAPTQPTPIDDYDDGPGVDCDDALLNIDDAIFVDEKCVFPPIDNPAQPRCGKRNTEGLVNNLDEARVGEANFGEWPHVCAILNHVQVGLDDENELVPVYVCGASLIAPQVVLTSGHCVNNTDSFSDNLSVRCGEWDTTTTDELLPFQERRVNRIMKHPDLDVDNHHKNFALLFLSNAFEIQDHISPMCLPKPRSRPLDGQFCVSHGWGKDKFGNEGEYQTRLKEVVIPIVENDQCENDLRGTRLGEYFELDESFICAGGIRGIDTCKGDGGSPLVCQLSQGSWYQAGIVSYGIGCGESGIPGVYSDVSYASCWIDQEVSNFYDEASYYGFGDEDCDSEYDY